jgi:F-type H+-transporting ATPase subunit alpha
MVIYAGISGMLDDITLAKVQDFEREFLKFMDSMHPDIGKAIKETRELQPAAEEKLKAAILEFKNIFK